MRPTNEYFRKSFLNELPNRQDEHPINIDKTYLKVGCVIMASGQGKRFGNNKLLAHFHGKSLYQRTFELIDQRLFDMIVVITRTREVYEKALEHGMNAVLHDMTDRNDVVRLGVEQMADMDACVFCPCDQPLLKRESLERLVDGFCRGDGNIIRLSWNENPGTPILFSREYFGELSSLPKKKGGSYLAEKYKEATKYVQVTDESELMDIDTKEDLEILTELLSAKGVL